MKTDSTAELVVTGTPSSWFRLPAKTPPAVTRPMPSASARIAAEPVRPYALYVSVVSATPQTSVTVLAATSRVVLISTITWYVSPHHYINRAALPAAGNGVTGRTASTG